MKSKIGFLRKTRMRLVRGVEKFFLEPASPRPLAALRIGLSFLLIIQAYLLRNSILDFFSSSGIVQGELVNFLSTPHTPRVSWLVQALSPWGVEESTCVFATCWAYLISLVFLLIGKRTRWASISAWFLHWALSNTGCTTTYGVDLYAHVFLFYLMWVPCGDALSVDAVLSLPSDKANKSWEARLGLRVIQLHLCIAYLFSGIDKAQGIQWWNGELLWRALNLPVYRVFDMTWLAQWPFLSKLGGWMTLFLELGYSVFIWPKATRPLWVFCIVAMHLGIAIFLGLGLFGVVMCILTLSVFGVSAEPQTELKVTGKTETKVEVVLLH